MVGVWRTGSASRAAFLLLAKPEKCFPKAVSIALPADALGACISSLSIKITSPSLYLRESTVRSAFWLMERLILRAYILSLRGPWVTPPPFHIGERDEPWRARPVPFCCQGLRPPRRTSPRVLVCAEDWRALACIAVTTWWTRSAFHGKPKSASGRVIFPASLPCMLYILVSISVLKLMCTSLRVRRSPADLDKRATASGYGAGNDYLARLGQYLEHRQIAYRYAVATHAACHAHAFGNATSGAAASAADRAGATVAVLLGVRGRAAMESVALNNALEAAALGYRRDDYLVADRKGRHVYRRANLGEVGINGALVSCGARAQLAEVAQGLALGVAHLRLVGAARLDLPGTKLHSVIAVTLGSLYLSNDVGGGINDGRGKGPAFLRKDSRHLALCSKDEFHVVYWSPL